MGGCCAALAVLQRVSGAAPAAASEPTPPAPPVPVPAGPPLSTAELRVDFAERWAKRFFDVFDAHLDEATRTKIMMANGRACHESSLRGQTIQPVSVDDFIAQVRARIGDDAIRREGDTVYFHYVQNPRGRKVADGSIASARWWRLVPRGFRGPIAFVRSAMCSTRSRRSPATR